MSLRWFCFRRRTTFHSAAAPTARWRTRRRHHKGCQHHLRRLRHPRRALDVLRRSRVRGARHAKLGLELLVSLQRRAETVRSAFGRPHGDGELQAGLLSSA